jgi:hypothetical protein
MIHWLEIVKNKDCIHSIIGAVWQQNTLPISSFSLTKKTQGFRGVQEFNLFSNIL